MIITNFDSFNEEAFNFDLKKIKEEAQKFAKSKDCVRLFSQVDTDLLDSVIEELQKLKQKWGSLDTLSQKLFAKAESTNEGVGSTIILSAFGIHAFWKLLVALKNGWGFKKYLGRLFHSSGDYDLPRTVFRDLVITITFLIYVIVYIVTNNNYTTDYHKTANGRYTELQYKWDGLHNYIFKDGTDKEYYVKRNSFRDFDVLYKGKKIGKYDLEYFYRLDGTKVIADVSFGKHDYVPEMSSIDMLKILVGKRSKKVEDEIKNRESEIEKLEKEIDSLNKRIYENVDMAKKIFKEAGKDYDKIVNTPRTEIHNLGIKDRAFLHIKDILTKNNNLGYLGLFANLVINDSTLGMELESLYNKIVKNKDILSNLRDNNGNLCSLFDFNKVEHLEDSLERLEKWRKVNQFMREIPSTQKRLIWQDSFWTDELKSKSQFLTSSIVRISRDPNLSRTFLSKISAAKTADTIIDSIVRITNQQPWDFDYWLNKLNNSRNVYVTWSSKEDKQIICVVTGYQTIKKIAYMTNWCITRDKDYFDSSNEKLPLAVFNRSE